MEKLVDSQDFPIFDYDCQKLGDYNFTAASGFDDAIGTIIVVEIMKELAKNKEFCAGVYGVLTVQEEIGYRGANVAANLYNLISVLMIPHT